MDTKTWSKFSCRKLILCRDIVGGVVVQHHVTLFAVKVPPLFVLSVYLVVL